MDHEELVFMKVVGEEKILTKAMLMDWEWEMM